MAFPAHVAGLLRPEAFPHPADALQVHETHISWVILAGPYAYKLKKPVDLGFLDFTTLERRVSACLDEVRLNRRLCPDVYLGVARVLERDGQYVVETRSQAGEPAVRMRRLPQDGMLPVLLGRGTLRSNQMRALANLLARFHADAASGPEVVQYGTPEVVEENWTENFQQTNGLSPAVLLPEIREEIQGYVRRFLLARSSQLRGRLRAGRIRDGHGDLHTGNICLEDGRFQVFDCIEFNARFRCADVAAEVGFLAMDLDHHGRNDLSRAFVDGYIAASGDLELKELLAFYSCYRAYVRGKVIAMRLEQSGLGDDERSGLSHLARTYFEQSLSYARSDQAG